MKPIYVLVDAKTGEFWKPERYNRHAKKRAIYAFLSEGRALSTLSQFHPQPDPSEVIVKRFVPGAEVR